MKNFVSVSTSSLESIPSDLLKFMRKWGKVNDFKSEIESLIDDYEAQVIRNIEEKEEGLKKQNDNIKFILKLTLGDDHISCFSSVQICKTENDCLVHFNGDSMKPISLDEVTLVILGKRELLDPRILEIAEDEDVDILNADEPVYLVFTKRSHYPYIVRGGLLFWRKWISINQIAQQKFTLSETVGDTRMTIDDKVLDGIISFYHDENQSLHLFDKSGNKFITDFNLKHDMVDKQIPDDCVITNICLIHFVTYIISEQMFYEGNKEYYTIKINDGENEITAAPGAFVTRENKLYLGEREMFELVD